MTSTNNSPDPRLHRLAHDSFESPILRGVLPPPGDRWVISPELATLLFRLVTEYRLRRILEFGAGASSGVFAAALAEIGGGSLTSVEQQPEWCADQWHVVESRREVDPLLIHAQPQLSSGRGGVYYAFKQAESAIAQRAPYDLMLVDAPQYFYGRDGALHLAHPYLAEGAFIILDDARRSAERWSMRRWLRTYPGLTLRLYDRGLGGRGVAVLQATGPLKPRLDVVSVGSSSVHAVQCWFKRRRRQEKRDLKRAN